MSYLSSAVSAYVRSDCQASLFITNHVVISNLAFQFNFFLNSWPRMHFYRLHTNDFLLGGLVMRDVMLARLVVRCVCVCVNVIFLGVFFCKRMSVW